LVVVTEPRPAARCCWKLAPVASLVAACLSLAVLLRLRAAVLWQSNPATAALLVSVDLFRCRRALLALGRAAACPCALALRLPPQLAM
jgi:hypothetical protein